MVCELDAKTRTKRLFVLVGAHVAHVARVVDPQEAPVDPCPEL